MKYYLVHMTYSYFDWEAEILAEVDLELPVARAVDVRAGKRRAGKQRGRWELDPKWWSASRNTLFDMAKSVKRGIYENKAFKYEARGLTEEEVAMILFQAEKVVN